MTRNQPNFPKKSHHGMSSRNNIVRNNGKGPRCPFEHYHTKDRRRVAVDKRREHQRELERRFLTAYGSARRDEVFE